MKFSWTLKTDLLHPSLQAYHNKICRKLFLSTASKQVKMSDSPATVNHNFSGGIDF